MEFDHRPGHRFAFFVFTNSLDRAELSERRCSTQPCDHQEQHMQTLLHFSLPDSDDVDGNSRASTNDNHRLATTDKRKINPARSPPRSGPPLAAVPAARAQAKELPA